MTTTITIHAHDGWPVQVINQVGGPNGNAETHTLAPGETRDFQTNGNALVVKEMSGQGVRAQEIRDPSDPKLAEGPAVERVEPMTNQPNEAERAQEKADLREQEEARRNEQEYVDHD